MAFNFSPNVSVIERDLSTSVPSLPTTLTGMVGDFEWGPCRQIVDINNDKELVDIFGLPNDTNFLSFFSAWNFLQYSQGLKVVRVINENTAKNAGLEIKDATAGSTAAVADLIVNDEEGDSYTPTYGSDAKLQFFAKYPGTKGNKIKVAVANATDFPTAEITTGVTFINNFEYAPATGEIAVVILYNDEIVEKYNVSLTAGSLDYEGNNNYAPTYINRRSKYVLVFNDASNTDLVDSIVATALTGGVGEVPANSDVTIGYDLFESPEDVTINILIDGGFCNSVVHQHIIDNIVDVRKDCIFYLTCPKDAVVGVANITTAIANLSLYRKTTLARSSSYAALYGNWKYQYDQYNDKYRWVSLSGDIAGITAVTHFNRAPWFAPMGYNRGIVKNVVKLAINPKRAHRDTLQRDFINPVVNDSSVGPVVLGQKTLIKIGRAHV